MSTPKLLGRAETRLAPSSVRKGLRWAAGLVAVLGVVCGWASYASAAGTSAIQITLSAWVQGVQTTAPIFPFMTVEYRVDVHNTGTTDSGPISLAVSRPIDSVYVPGTASCGTIPVCSLNISSLAFTPGRATFTIGSVPAGATGEGLFDVTPRTGAVYQPLISVGQWVGPDCHGLCRTNRVTNLVEPRPVSLTSTPGNGATVASQSMVVYSIAVNNLHKTPQDSVTVIDPIPPGTSYIPNSGTCEQTPACTVTPSSGNVTFNIGSLPPKAHYKLALSVNVTAPSGTIANTATWIGDLCSINPPCPTAAVKQAVAGNEVTVTKSANPFNGVNPGGTITYSFTVSNPSANDSGPVMVTDTVPPGTTFVTGSTNCDHLDECQASESNGIITFDFSTVTANGQATVSFKVVVDSGATGAIGNTGTWVGGSCASSTGCPTNTVSVPIITPGGPGLTGGGGGGAGGGAGGGGGGGGGTGGGGGAGTGGGGGGGTSPGSGSPGGTSPSGATFSSTATPLSSTNSGSSTTGGKSASGPSAFATTGVGPNLQLLALCGLLLCAAGLLMLATIQGVAKLRRAEADD